MITYLKGDATNPQVSGNKAIIHICNNQGGWGRGFVLALSKKWLTPEMRYRFWFTYNNQESEFELGNIQRIQVEHDIWIFNMIAQKGYKQNNTSIPLQYDALEQCLSKVAIDVRQFNATIHAPRIGCGLAGGEWSKVEEIINETCKDIDVFIYDL
jgi:O-acetyl-ADP-ribose deacetylase (regulator of RNase III)